MAIRCGYRFGLLKILSQIIINKLKLKFMKMIKNLDVKVTYRVGLGNVEISDEVYNQLNEIIENGGEIDITSMDNSDAIDWLRDNIREDDSYDCQYYIEDLD